MFLLNETANTYHNRDIVVKPIVVYLLAGLLNNLLYVQWISDRHARARCNAVTLAKLLYNIRRNGNDLVGERIV